MAAKKTAAKKAPAKKAAKKAPAKKAAKKAPAKKAAKKTADITLEDPDKLKPIVFKKKFGDKDKKAVLGKMTANIRQSVSVLSERSKTRPVKLLTPAMLRRTLVPYDELYFQYMLSSIGFRTPSAIEIIAPDHIGKTTFVMDMIARLLDAGCYSIYCECEGKMMSDKRIKRIMDRDPKLATLKINSIEFTEARTLDQFDEVLRKTVEDLRKRCDSDPETKGNPIWFFADPWSGLMSKGEAKGNSDWGLAANAKKEAPKETTAGSNFEHAKHAQGMKRWLPSFLEKNNCTAVFVNAQNDKIDMGGKTLPAYMAPSPLKNDTRIGGRALRQICPYRFTMLNIGDIREKGGDKKIYGAHVRMMLVKNSYGPRDRTCEFTVFFDNHEDRPDYLAPAITFADRTATWMVKKKFLGTTVEKDLFTCDTLGCVAVPAGELYDALKAHPEHIDYIGSQLGIEGYSSEVKYVEPKEEEEDDSPAPDDLVPEDEEVPPDVVPEDEESAGAEEEEPTVVP